MSGEVIKVTGLRELRTSLRRIDTKLPRKIREAGNEAARIVVAVAKPRVPIGPGRNGHAVDSIKAASTQSSVGVAEGSAKYKYMPWLDFGGTINRHTSHPTKRPFIKHGRYIWAAFAENRGRVIDTYQRGLDRTARESGLRVT